MTSWIKTYLSLELKPAILPTIALEVTNKLIGSSSALHPPPSLSPLQLSPSLSQIQKEMTMILTNIILFNQQHQKEECHA